MNRTASWNHWTDAKACGGPPPRGAAAKGHDGYDYRVKPFDWRRSRTARDWLETPSLRLVLSTQHQAVRHPKLVAIPLGVRHSNVAQLMALVTGIARPPRTRWLLINNSGWKFRSAINDAVAANFDPPLRNTYCGKKNCPAATPFLDADARIRLMKRPPDLDAFFEHALYGQILTSKFVLCPPGLGADSYCRRAEIFLRCVAATPRPRRG